MKGKIVILSGPSGAGKDTVIDAWRLRNPVVKRVVAYTTRAPRPGEVNGEAYHFVTRDDFMDRANSGQFLEWKEVHGNLYATPLEDLRTMVDAGLIAVLKIDVQGAIAAMEKLPEAISIFLMPPSIEELEHRLRERHTDSADEINKRLENAEWEISNSSRYKYRVVNDDVNRAVAEIEEICRQPSSA